MKVNSVYKIFCKQCGVNKPAQQFHISKLQKRSFTYLLYCKDCNKSSGVFAIDFESRNPKRAQDDCC